jgi:pimeloyl-ACP methyl ester carboxylesterase
LKPLTIETSKIEIKDGSTIAYRIAGDRSKPAILFLNGSIFNYKQFDPILFPSLKKYVKDKYHFIHYDYVGFGESSAFNGEFDFLDITRQHVEFLDALYIEAAHHFGFSKGSLISFLTAASHPDRTLSVVGYGNPNLASPSPQKTKAEFAKRVQFLNGITGIWNDLVDEKNFKVVYDTVFLPTIFIGKTVSNLSLREKILNWWIMRKLFPMLVGTRIENIAKLYRYYMNDTSAEDQERYIEAMGSISIPTMLMHGTQDEIIPYEAAVALSKIIPTSELKEFPYDHTSPMLHPLKGRRIMKTYANFLNDISITQ